MALICDTGPLYAAIDRRDPANHACTALLAGSVEPRLIPAPVLVELDWLVTSRYAGPGPSPFAGVLDDIAGGAFRVVNLVAGDYLRIGALCRRYADLPLGFVDAAVLAVVERLGETKVATLDHRHFQVVRLEHTAELTLLP